MDRRDVKITISQYSMWEDEYLDTFTFTFDELTKYVARYQTYYWRVELFGKPERKLISTTHFARTVSSRGSLYSNEADFINGFLNYIIRNHYRAWKKNRQNPGYTWSFWDLIVRDLLYLNRIEACKLNNKTDFNDFLNQYLRDIYVFNEITNLDTLAGVPGVYCMVLDRYNTCYVGQSKDMKRRILNHWSTYNYNSTGIDIFKALDTTRIFAFSTTPNDCELLDTAEIIAVDHIYGKYCLNFFPGGSIYNMLSLQNGFEKFKNRPEVGHMNFFQIYQLIKRNAPEALRAINRFIV